MQTTVPTPAAQQLVDSVYNAEKTIRANALRARKTNSGRIAEQCCQRMDTLENQLRTSLIPSLAQHMPELATAPITLRASCGGMVEVDVVDGNPFCKILDGSK